MLPDVGIELREAYAEVGDVNIEQHFGHGASSQFEAAETPHRCA
jgi:hypothetical protein